MLNLAEILMDGIDRPPIAANLTIGGQSPDRLAILEL
jgi:hypothetical protein